MKPHGYAKNMNLVYFSPVPWESFSQRPHKFVNWFHRKFGATILWVDPYPTRLPNLHDFRRIFRSSTPHLAQTDAAGVTVLRHRALPIEPLPFSELINSWFWRETLNRILDVCKESAYLAAGKPSKLAIIAARSFPDRFLLYDGMDDFPAFYRGHSRRSMSRNEAWMIDRAKYVFTSSSALHDRWTKIRPDVQLVLNGLDPEVISRSLNRPLNQEKKTFGYVGTIGNWFDWQWTYELCRVRPRDTIRIIGPTLQPPPLPLPANIELLPPCSHSDAMKAMQYFDVGLIPFKRTDLTAAVDPIKYYEYIAAGIPVISTNFGEMARRIDEPGVYVSQEIHDIDSLADQAINSQLTTGYIETFIRTRTWANRFDEAVLRL